ncbi:PAAR domain-containing protein [Duganella margarita]|uniref:PAAR domain-containing protein n=1 Tax=Duganella margarita TaxID=2692170 RepID=UPI001E2D70CC|nr:PAAR domain-containing protein [Duganella margarita]
MKRHTITLGASTTVGGKVISASSNGSINGVGIALEGDMIFCPACKSKGKIVCVGPRIPETWNGKNVALENDSCVCGCPGPPRLVPNQSVRYQIIGETSDTSQATDSTVGETASRLTMFDDRYALIDEETGNPLANTEYALRRESGELEFGTTDSQGHTHLLEAEVHAESIQIYS